MKTLFVLSHPTFNESFANQIIWHGLHELMPAAEFAHLDAAYPHLPIDVAKEQARLAAADVIVMQFPMFWYSVPGLMKRWIDDVFVHGFAHGSQGNKLHGKKLILSFTTGGAAELYERDNYMEHTMEEFLYPLRRWAKQCGMEWQPYVHTDSLPYIATDEMRGEMAERAKAHAEKLAAQIAAL